MSFQSLLAISDCIELELREVKKHPSSLSWFESDQAGLLHSVTNLLQVGGPLSWFGPEIERRWLILSTTYPKDVGIIMLES